MKIKDLRIRFEWQGYDPREALTTRPFLKEYEISIDGGLSYRVGEWGKTLQDVSEWLDENSLVVDNAELVDQRNGRGGWFGEYVLSFKKRVVPAEEAEKLAGWLDRASRIQDHVSVPEVGEVKPHGSPGATGDPVTAALLRGSTPC